MSPQIATVSSAAEPSIPSAPSQKVQISDENVYTSNDAQSAHSPYTTESANHPGSSSGSPNFASESPNVLEIMDQVCPPETMNRLVRVYFEKSSIMWPILHQPSFLKVYFYLNLLDISYYSLILVALSHTEREQKRSNDSVCSAFNVNVHGFSTLL